MAKYQCQNSSLLDECFLIYMFSNYQLHAVLPDFWVTSDHRMGNLLFGSWIQIIIFM